jgi:hypothetical protein
MSGAVPPLPITPPRRGAHLKHRDNFAFSFLPPLFFFFFLCVGDGKIKDGGRHSQIFKLCHIFEEFTLILCCYYLVASGSP